ncbi:MAG: T9SS type A sorting domain-containing protein, partial [Tannerella sp.]|nr:T9SS type A sorting domain-containing protein [Tannerella sp.]
VTIYDIRSNISINAVPSSLQPVDDGSIRGGIGKAYITTPTDYTARIYNIAGQTVTTLKAKAGENVVTLPAGVYLVESHNGAVAKIIVQ